MSHSERHRKRALRLKRHIKELRTLGKPPERIEHFERELSNLITGKKPAKPVGTAVGVKPMRRKK